MSFLDEMDDAAGMKAASAHGHAQAAEAVRNQDTSAGYDVAYQTEMGRAEGALIGNILGTVRGTVDALAPAAAEDKDEEGKRRTAQERQLAVTELALSEAIEWFGAAPGLSIDDEVKQGDLRRLWQLCRHYRRWLDMRLKGAAGRDAFDASEDQKRITDFVSRFAASDVQEW